MAFSHSLAPTHVAVFLPQMAPFRWVLAMSSAETCSSSVKNLIPGQQIQNFRKESLDKVLIRSQYHNTSIRTHKLLKRRVVGVDGGLYGQIGLFKDKLLFKKQSLLYRGTSFQHSLAACGLWRAGIFVDSLRCRSFGVRKHFQLHSVCCICK